MDATMTNAFDGDRLRDILSKIDDAYAELASRKGSFMEECREIRQGIAGRYQEAKAFDLPVKELKALVTLRKRIESARKALDDLEEEARQTVIALADAAGEQLHLDLTGE